MMNSRPRCSRTFSSDSYTLTTMVFVSHVHQCPIHQHCVYTAIQAELVLEKYQEDRCRLHGMLHVPEGLHEMCDGIPYPFY